MSKFAHHSLAAITAAIITGPVLAQDAPPSRTAAMTAYVEAHRANGDFSGCLIVEENRDRLLERCWGFADAEHGAANTLDTSFRIGSVTKQITAYAILLLVDEGRLALDQTIERYAPDLRNADRITLHHLLTHTSGVPDLFAAPGYDNLRTREVSTQDLLDLLSAAEPGFEPGINYAYSNGGYAVLAHIIGEAGNSTYRDVVNTRIFDPLGLDASRVDNVHEIIPARARGYDPAGLRGYENAPFRNPSASIGSGSIVMSAADLLAFTKELENPTLVDPALVDRMLTAHNNAYGYGISVYSLFGRPVIGHDGREPGFIADTTWYPESDVRVILIGNLQTAVSDEFRRDLAAIVFGEDYTLPALRAVPAGAPSTAILDAAIGAYAFGPAFRVEVAMRDGRLFARAGESDFTELAYAGDDSFLARALFASVRFESDTPGTPADRMLWSQDGNTFTGTRIEDA